MIRGHLIHNPADQAWIGGHGMKDDRDFDQIIAILEEQEKDGHGTFLFRDSKAIIYCTQANVIWKYVNLDKE